MSKRKTKVARRGLFRLPLLSLMLGSLWPLAGVSQQTSPIVNSNISESGSLSSRKGLPPSVQSVSPVPEGFENLRLSPGFLLHLEVYDAPEMSMDLRIDSKGDLAVPLIEPVHVENLTVQEAEKAVAQSLVDHEIFKEPQVTLNILQFSARNVSVLGEVQSPGRVQLLSPEPLGNVLALVGGETIAAGSDIEIQHQSDGGQPETRHVRYEQGKDQAVLQSSIVDPGDTVLVHRAGIIYVLGAVNRPGGYLMVNGGTLNVLQAISLASGETIQASSRWAIVIRRQGDGFIQFKVPLKKMETGEATPAELQLNDALYVPTSGWKVAFLNGSALLSATASAAIYRAP